MPSKGQIARVTIFRANEMESKQAGPFSLPQHREEVVPHVYKIHQHELMPPPAVIDLDHILTDPRAYLTNIVGDNRSLRQIVTNQKQTMEHPIAQIKRR